MLKKFLKSNWPFMVMMAIGFLAFIAGTIFGKFMPKECLEALVWASLVSFIVGFMLLAKTCGMDEDMVFGSAITGGGALFLVLWYVFKLLGLIDINFVDTDTFKCLSSALIFLGMTVVGIVMLVKSIDQKSWLRAAYIEFGILFVLAGCVLANLAEIIILPGKSDEIFLYVLVADVVLGVITTGKLAKDYKLAKDEK